MGPSEDVEVWEIVYSKDGSVKEVLNVMQLKGHKSAWPPLGVPFSKPIAVGNANDEENSFNALSWKRFDRCYILKCSFVTEPMMKPSGDNNWSTRKVS